MRTRLALLAVLALAAPAAADPFLVAVGSPDGAFPLPSARTVAVSPEGTHVYAGGGDTLVAFQRNQGTGGIATIETHVDGVAGDDGLAGIADIAISPDGAYLYAAGHDEDAIAIYARTPLSGALSLVDVVRDGVGGVDGLAGVDELVVAGSGAHLYVAGDEDNSLTLFSRDGGTGLLTFVELHRDGVGGVTQIDGNGSLAVAPDGADVYMGSAFSFGSAGLVHFRRNVSTGALTFVGPVQFANASFSPESAPALVPDGLTLFFAGAVPFDRDPATGVLTESEAFGLPSFGRPNEVVVNATGSALYKSDTWVDTLDADWRDPYSGDFGQLDRLSFVGEEGVSLAPGGAHVYAVGNDMVTAARVACAPIVIRTKLTVTGIADAPGNDVVRLRGDAIAFPGTFAALNPVATGMRFMIEDTSPESTLLDVNLPAAAFGGKGPAGWKLDGTGTTWTYVDATNSPGVAGILRVKIQDRGALIPGQVKIGLKGRDSTYPVGPNDSWPPRIRLEFGTDACFGTAFQFVTTDPTHDCEMKSQNNKLACRLPF